LASAQQRGQLHRKPFDAWSVLWRSAIGRYNSVYLVKDLPPENPTCTTREKKIGTKAVKIRTLYCIWNDFNTTVMRIAKTNTGNATPHGVTRDLRKKKKRKEENNRTRL
jgi:hypothetical protein